MITIKNTVQKAVVISSLKLLDHPTADEIYDHIHCSYPSISKATVYRILKCMANDGEILHLCVPDGPDRFDTTVSNHYHIKCSSCGKLCDIDLPEIYGIYSKIEAKSGYSITGCKLFFDGICPECGSKQPNE